MEEILTEVVNVKANNIDEAFEKVDELYKNQEVILGEANCTERNMRNLYSKKMDNPLNLFINYDSQSGYLTILGANKLEKIYACDTMRNMISCFKQFVEEEYENSEIDVKQGHQIDLELGYVDLESEEELDK